MNGERRLQELAEALRQHGYKAAMHGHRLQFQCPVHGDDTPSASAIAGDKGLILKCHAQGCDKEAMLKAVGWTLRDLFYDADSTAQAPTRERGRIVKTYAYSDADGALLFEVVRFDPKDFRQRRPDGKGGWEWNLKGVPRVLYRLPELIGADPAARVWIVEGEKDADNGAAVGLVTTTSPQGAGKWDKLEDTSILHGRRVAIIADKDDTGRKHAGQVAASLSGKAAEVRVLELPGQGKDLSDWLDGDMDAKEPAEIVAALEALAEASPIWTPPTPEPEKADLPRARADKWTVAEVAKLNTDVGNAARFIMQHGEGYLYAGEWGCWLRWDGRRWVRDTTLDVMDAGKGVALAILDEAKAAKGDQFKELIRHAVSSNRRERIAAMIDLSRPDLAVSVADLDADLWALNVYNGTVDLKTGQLRPHARKDLITRLAPVRFDPEATCPRWRQFLQEIMPERPELVKYLQMILGMSLTGDVREQFIYIAWGVGANGKSALFDTVRGITGDYSTDAPSELLVQKFNAEHPTEVATLFGRRLVVASETEEGGRLRVQLVKQLTGNARIQARFMRQDYFEFDRTFKLFLLTNNKPRIRESSHAVWRRVRLIPFDVVVPEERQDKALPEKLKAEWPGILNWLIEGCLLWQRAGALPTPEAVKEATAGYEQDENPLAEYLETRCAMGTDNRVPCNVLLADYKDWCAQTRERVPVGRNDFIERMRRLPGVKRIETSVAGKFVRMFTGIGLLAEQSGDNYSRQGTFGQEYANE